MIKPGYIYILASKRRGTLYIGVTSNLAGRVSEHKRKILEGFTKKYNVTELVHYETFRSMNDAIKRETHLKTLIEKNNPEWNDLFFEII